MEADKFHLVDRTMKREAELAAENLGCALVELDLSDVHSEDDLFDALAETLRFPGYFGRNWNALLDMLSDLSWWESNRFLFMVDGAQSLFEESPAAFQAFFEVLQSAALRMRSTGSAIYVGLVGDVPRFELETAIGVKTVCAH